MIVVLTGGDASGKATQSRILAERLGAALFTFPDYSTTIGKAILGNLKGEWYVTSGWDETDSGGDSYIRREAYTNALALQSLMNTNRIERTADLKAAALRGHVICDRYDVDALVYGALDGLEPAWLEGINAQLPVKPDLYILLDVPVDEGFKRRPARRDRYERDVKRMEDVRVAYLKLFTQRQEEYTASVILPKRPCKTCGGGMSGTINPDTGKSYMNCCSDCGGIDKLLAHISQDKMPRWRVVDGTGTIEEVSARVREAVGL